MAETITYEEMMALFKETREQFKESDVRIAKIEALIAETDAQLKETDAQIARVSEQLGGMCNSNGAFAEEYFANASAGKLEFAGQRYDEMSRNLVQNNRTIKDEFDIVMYNGKSVAIIEVKYKAQTEDLEKMVTKKVPNFRALFPHYAHHEVYLGIGSLSFNEYVYAKAKELGIGLLKQKGDTIEADTSFVRAY